MAGAAAGAGTPGHLRPLVVHGPASPCHHCRPAVLLLLLLLLPPSPVPAGPAGLPGLPSERRAATAGAWRGSTPAGRLRGARWRTPAAAAAGPAARRQPLRLLRLLQLHLPLRPPAGNQPGSACRAPQPPPAAPPAAAAPARWRQPPPASPRQSAGSVGRRGRGQGLVGRPGMEHAGQRPTDACPAQAATGRQQRTRVIGGTRRSPAGHRCRAPTQHPGQTARAGRSRLPARRRPAAPGSRPSPAGRPRQPAAAGRCLVALRPAGSQRPAGSAGLPARSGEWHAAEGWPAGAAPGLPCSGHMVRSKLHHSWQG